MLGKKDADILKKYHPMTETALYILISLIHKRHGYEIIKHIERITKGEMVIGAGTIYGSLSKFEKDGLIECVEIEEIRKTYLITPLGIQILKNEIERIEIVNNICQSIRESLYEEKKAGIPLVDSRILPQT